MKKVRYAVGAVGLAPALGLAIPAANAAATTAYIHGHAGKTVRPLANCGDNQHQDGYSVNGRISGGIYYSNNLCVYKQLVTLFHYQTGLTERTRFYSGDGRLERTTWQAGKVAPGSTRFSSFPNMYAHQVCMALVANSNHNDVEYGPICFDT
jgi:hypothetical protein